jgi:myo-inositol-1-phosphate synthase
MGIVGALRGPSAFTQKTPPKQMMFADAVNECEALANRKLTTTTKKQVVANKVTMIKKEKVAKN